MHCNKLRDRLERFVSLLDRLEGIRLMPDFYTVVLAVSALSAPFQVDNMDEMHQDPFMDVGYLNGAQDAPTRGRGGPGRGRGGPPLPMPGARYKFSLVDQI